MSTAFERFRSPAVAPHGSSGGVAWNEIYRVDLTAQGSIASIASGSSFDVGGKTWWCKGSLGNLGTASLIAGQGLRIMRSEQNNWFGYSTGGPPGALYLPFSQLKKYNPDAPIAVQLWWSNVDTAYPGNATNNAGLCAAAANGDAITDDEQNTALWHVCQFDQEGARTILMVRNQGLSEYNYVSTLYNVPDVKRHRYTLVQPYVGRVVLAFSDLVALAGDAGGFVPVHQVHYSRVFSPVPTEALPARNAYGLAITTENHLGEPFGSHGPTLGGFQVLQTAPVST